MTRPSRQRYLIVISPDGVEKRIDFPGTAPAYELLRMHVGGMIAPLRLRYDGKLRQCYVHEEGLLIGLAQNDAATHLMRETFAYALARPADVLVGPLVIVI